MPQKFSTPSTLFFGVLLLAMGHYANAKIDGQIPEHGEAKLTFFIDADNDGLNDLWEWWKKTNPASPDSDGDSLNDGTEWDYGCNPLRTDFDNDGLNDAEEFAQQTFCKRPDSDHDGLADGTEVHGSHTDPLNPDTDGDGVGDLEDY